MSLQLWSYELGGTMRKAIALLAAAAALGLAAAPASAADKDCSDFSSWRQAQRFFKNHGGPRRDPHRLDADHDGIACESLR
jgi:DNA polymerase III delta prime subunit